MYIVGWNVNHKCCVGLTQARHPLMPDDSMAELLRRHLKGSLPEELWKEVVQGFCKPKVLPLPWSLSSAEFLCPGNTCGRKPKGSSVNILPTHFNDQPCLEWPISIKHPQQILEMLCLHFAGKFTLSSCFPSLSLYLTYPPICIVLGA
jgi:hypothetical protein